MTDVRRFLECVEFEDLASEVLLRLATPDTGRDVCLRFIQMATRAALDGAFADIPKDWRRVRDEIEHLAMQTVNASSTVDQRS